MMKIYKDYPKKTENCEVDYLSDLDIEESEELIGKTIKKVNSSEYALIIYFTDDSSLTIEGYRWDGCSLGVEYEQP